MKMYQVSIVAALAAAIGGSLLGCVERTVSITTEPDRALVWLNDKEVGRTPCTVHFTWYGDYDVVIRKDKYQPLNTHRRLVRPWYQYMPIDFFAELMIPATIQDKHAWHFQLQESKPVDLDALISRANELRQEHQ